MLIRRKYFKMFATLSLFSSLCGYASSSDSSTTKEGLSLDDIRERCLTAREGSQGVQPKLKVRCYGMKVVVDRQGDNINKQNSVHFEHEIMSKGGELQTRPFVADRDVDPMPLQCARVDLKTVSAPLGGVEVPLTICEELTKDKIEEICGEAIPKYCDGHMVDFTKTPLGEAPQDTTGMCTTDHLTTIDTCSYYR